MARTHTGGGRRTPCPFVADGQMEDFPAKVMEAEIIRTKVDPRKPPGYYAMVDGMAVGNPMLVLTWELQTEHMMGHQASHGYRTKSRHGLKMQDAQPCGNCDQFWKADKKCPNCQIHFARFWLESTDALLQEVFGTTREQVLAHPPSDLIGGQAVVCCISQLSEKGNRPFLMVEEVHGKGWRYEGSQETAERSEGAQEAPEAPSVPLSAPNTPPETQYPSTEPDPPYTQDDGTEIPF